MFYLSEYIREDGTSNPATQRAYHVDELKNSETLKLDFKYYLSQQIHPVISRLIEPIEGTDSAQIAESLGLDPTQFKEKPKPSEDFEAGDNVLLKEAERFKNCERFIFKCVNPDCCCDIVVDSPIRKNESGGNEFILESCANTDCKVQPLQYLVHIKNCLTRVMRSYITKYYQGWMICEDPACPQRTRRMPIHFDGSYPICTRCQKNNMYREYSEKDLYTQLCYLQHVFDITKPPHSSVRCSVDTFNAYCALKEHVARTLSCSGYSVVSLTKLFRGLFPEPIKIKKEPVDDS